MELNPNQPLCVSIHVQTSRRRHGTQSHEWVFQSIRAGMRASETAMQLAEHLRRVLCGLRTDTHIEAGLHSLFKEKGIVCPCRRIQTLRGVIRVVMQVTQPHVILLHGKEHRMREVHPAITIWDLTGAPSKRCGLCQSPIGSVGYASPCGHHFHVKCISRWGSQHPVCPVCGVVMHFSISIHE